MSAATQVSPRVPAAEPARETSFRRVFLVLAALAALALTAHAAAALWARHEFTQVESIVAIHARMLAGGKGLYYDLKNYPFTVSPYGPIYYSAVAALHRSGIPAMLAGRLLSIAALLTILALVYRTARLYSTHRFTAPLATLLAAATANLTFWGVVCQSDTVALAFSLGAFCVYSHYRRSAGTRTLVWAALLAVCAMFTKQTFVAAAGAACVAVFLARWRRGLALAVSLGAAVALLALLLNSATEGRFAANTIGANLNPFRAAKFAQQLEYFAATSGALLVIVLATLRRQDRSALPVLLYAGLALAVFLATAAKVGSDVNYQIETNVALALAAAVGLDRAGFYPALGRNERSWTPLLQIPIALHLVINLGATGNALLHRVVLEPVKRTEVAALQPYLDPSRGRVLAVQIDALQHTRGEMEVEPLIYTLLVEAGLSPAAPVLEDIEAAHFSAIVLFHDVDAPADWVQNPETPKLPAAHLDAIRRRYRLVRHVPGPYLAGDFVYEPRERR